MVSITQYPHVHSYSISCIFLSFLTYRANTHWSCLYSRTVDLHHDNDQNQKRLKWVRRWKKFLKDEFLFFKKNMIIIILCNSFFSGRDSLHWLECLMSGCSIYCLNYWSQKNFNLVGIFFFSHLLFIWISSRTRLTSNFREVYSTKSDNKLQ